MENHLPMLFADLAAVKRDGLHEAGRTHAASSAAILSGRRGLGDLENDGVRGANGGGKIINNSNL